METEVNLTSTKEDFRKFIKFFSTRLVQTIVQSRLGDDIEDSCLPPTHSHDWFSMKIEEVGEISANLKSHVQNFPPNGVLIMEFILYTASGHHLPLESWILRVLEEKDPHVDVVTDLYHQMSTLLRSATTAARMTPMHRLYVKKQHADTFVIMYRISDKPEISNLGAERKERRIARLPSPHGTLCLDLWYRTKMHLDEPEMEYDHSKENEEEAKEKNPKRPTFDDCVPLVKEGKKGQKSEGKNTPLSTTSSNLRNSKSSATISEGAPKFILGQSTSSEDSRNSEVANSVEEDSRPTLAELRNQSFPFVSLLQSAYTPMHEKKRLKSVAEMKYSEEAEKKKTEDEADAKKESLTDTNTSAASETTEESKIEMGGNEESEESFVEFVEFCDFGTTPETSQNELGELLKQLKTAPEILENQKFIWNSEKDLGNHLNQLGSLKEGFAIFVNHINAIAE